MSRVGLALRGAAYCIGGLGLAQATLGRWKWSVLFLVPAYLLMVVAFFAELISFRRELALLRAAIRREVIL